MFMYVFIFQHLEEEPPGIITQILEEKEVKFQIIHLYKDEELPSFEGCRALVVMGGSMGVNEVEKYPFLAKEISFIKGIIDAGKPCLGICLGSQLIAGALGARIYPGTVKEIGWYKIKLTSTGLKDPLFRDFRKTTVFQWHSDAFDLPEKAMHLASSEDFPNQAFRYGESTYALQFHPEATQEMISTWVRTGEDEILSLGNKSLPEKILKEISLFLPALHTTGSRFIEGWIKTFIL